MKFYIYYHIDPRDNQIRYIGKGKNRRAWKLSDRHAYHKNWLNELKQLGLKPIIQITEYFENEQKAFDKEREMIKSEREINNKLCNVTDGGEGCAGTRWEKIYSSEILKIRKERIRSLGAKNSANQKGKTLEEIYGLERSNEIKKAVSRKGEDNALFGRSLEEIHGLEKANEIKKAVSKAHLGKNLEELYGKKEAKRLLKLRSERFSGQGNPQYGKKGKEATCYGRTGDKHPLYGKNHSEETKKAIGLKSSTSKKVTDGIKIWNSVTELSKELNCHPQSLMIRIKKGKPTNGIIYQFA